jgi:hypothetical protein
MTPATIKALRGILSTLAQIDEDVRAASPKCAECGRPDGGIVPRGFTPHESGLVDRRRCPSATCPMRKEGAA